MMVFCTLSMVIIAEGIRRNALKNKKNQKSIISNSNFTNGIWSRIYYFWKVGQTEKEVLNLFKLV